MIIETITDPYHFWDWLKNSDSYQNNFSYDGANAVQAWYDEIGTDEDPIEFDPIAWCCEFSEYDSLAEAWHELVGTDEDDDMSIEYFEDRTATIQLDSGHIILGEF
jgi:hypothetical protein